MAPHHLATEAGVAILRAGGNAVDAAIAANAVLAVVVPEACGIGGDAFWLIWDAAEERQVALNGSGRSAAALDAAALRGSGRSRMPARGPLAINVPGAVRSWADAHRRFGRLAQSDILAPAIELAAAGFPAWDGFVESVEATVPIVEAAIGPRSGWAQVYRPSDRPWRLGERVVLPALAATLGRLADAGFDDLYDGELAERQVAGLQAAGSPIVLDDLRSHTSTWCEPIGSSYRGTRVTTHPPNSQGIVALSILAILERFAPPDPRVFTGGQGADARWLHLGIEASKLAWADRDALLTDPEAMDEPAGELVDRLLDPVYVAALAARIDPARASLPPASRAPVGGGTTYLAAVDGEGNAVSLIESNYMGFGSGVVDPATGIGYHNRGAYFSLEAGHPNELAPRKRTLHTLMPGMLFRDGRPWVVLGSMGGDAQPQILAQVASALVDGGVDVATAVGAPRWFVEPEDHFRPPVEVRAEPRFRGGTLDELRAMGHRVTATPAFSAALGHCHAIELVDGGPREGGTLAAATDPRSAGLPATW